MKHIKLFESFILENYSKSSFKFKMPDLYEMPTGLDRNKVYVVKLEYEMEALIYALMDYSQLEKTYELLNLDFIAHKIDWYSQMIYEFPDKPLNIKVGEVPYNQQVLLGGPLANERAWTIEILAETKGDRFPYYVYIPGGNESLEINKKLSELTKKCKVCGDAPDVVSGLPGQNIGGSIGSDYAVFDPGMGMKLSDIIYDKNDSGTYEDTSDDKGEGYYIRFNSLGSFLAGHHPSHSQFDRFRKVGGSFVVDNSKFFELLTYKQELINVRELINKKEGARDFLDDIFEYLIGVYTPLPIIKVISDVLNPEDYQNDAINFYKVKFYNYKKGWSEKNQKYSEYPNYISGRGFFLALPDDKSIVNAILNKLPKDYNEIYGGLDSMDRSVLQKYRDEYESLGSSFRFPTLDSFKEMLKSLIHLVENDTLSKQKAILYDGELPSIDVLKDETNCDYFYGILGNITIDEINRMSPIELYFDIFYNKKNLV
jgi:hypothetical protein